VEAYGAKRYSGGKRERKYYTVTESFGSLAGKNGRVIVIPAPET
jgi:hypothetical protein